MFQTSLAMLLCLSMAVLCNRVSPPSRGLRSRLLSVRPLHWGLLGAAKCQAIRSVFGSGIPSGPGALRADVGSGRLLFQLLQLPHGPQVSSSSLLTQRPPVLSCKADMRGGTQNTKRFLLIYSFVCLSSVFHLDELHVTCAFPAMTSQNVSHMFYCGKKKANRFLSQQTFWLTQVEVIILYLAAFIEILVQGHSFACWLTLFEHISGMEPSFMSFPPSFLPQLSSTSVVLRCSTIYKDWTKGLSAGMQLITFASLLYLSTNLMYSYFTWVITFDWV